MVNIKLRLCILKFQPINYSFLLLLSLDAYFYHMVISKENLQNKKVSTTFYFNFRSDTRFANIQLETQLNFIWRASRVNVIVENHSQFRIGFRVLGFTGPVTVLPTRGVFGFHHATAICYRYQDVGYQTLLFKSIKDSLGLLNPS